MAGSGALGAAGPAKAPRKPKSKSPSRDWAKSLPLGREDILAAKPVMERVATPEWGGHVYVRTISLAERQAFEDGVQMLDEDDPRDAVTDLVAMAVCDENGALLFTPGDVPVLRTKASAALLRVFEKAMALNAILEKDIEDLTKN